MIKYLIINLLLNFRDMANSRYVFISFILVVIIISEALFIWKYLSDYNKIIKSINREFPLISTEEKKKSTQEEPLLNTQGEETKSPEEEQPLLSNTPKCDQRGIAGIITGPFRYVGDVFGGDVFGGEAIISGQIIVRDEKLYYEDGGYMGETKAVYFKIPPQYGDTPEGRFYSYFINKERTSKGKDIELGDPLLFHIGELINDGKAISSIANISPRAEVKMLSAIKTGEIVPLWLKVPVWWGRGVPPNFSFACAIELVED